MLVSSRTHRRRLAVNVAGRWDHPDMHIEFLWFGGCPNHVAARALLADVIEELAPGTPIEDIDASDPAVAIAHRFPGSPTIRVDGRDIDPGYQDRREYAPACRVYRTPEGLRGLPPRAWIEDALLLSLHSDKRTTTGV